VTPLVTLITPVRNAASHIRACLESVHRQSAPYEHIIVDGLSTDGTAQTVERCRAEFGDADGPDRILRVVSQADEGMYDAVNRGIRMARGEIIGILNADDVYADDRVLDRVRTVFEDTGVDSCYGDLVYVSSAGGDKVVRTWKAGRMTPSRFLWGWMPPHPTFCVRRRVYDECGVYRLDMGSAADYELMLRVLHRLRVSTRYIPEIIVRMRAGGTSNRSLANRINANRVDRKAWRVNGLTPHPWTLWLKPLRKAHQFLVRG
jgi:glycosyltransferase involved in cell wall biosynthesis